MKSQVPHEQEQYVAHPDARSSRWARAVNTIYQLKLWITILLLAFATIGCYTLANWLKGPVPEQWTWLGYIPWESLASSAVGIIVVAFAYEWIVRRETEEKLVQTLDQRLHAQEEVIANRISRKMLTDHEIMRHVLAPEMVDAIIQTGLEIRLGDCQLAGEAYDNLLSQLLISEERRSNYRCKVSLTPVRDKDVSEDVRQTYYEVYINVQYETVLRKDTFRFTSVATTREYNELLRDPSWELRWIVEPTKDFPEANASVFDVDYVMVDEKLLEKKAEKWDGKYVIGATHPALSTMIGQMVKVDYRYRAKIQKRGHLLMINVPCLTKNIVVELDYSDTDIYFVNVQDLFVSKARSIIRYLPSDKNPRKTEIEVNEWVFPKGGVVFVWVLRSEMTPDFISLLAQGKSPQRTDGRTTRQL